MLAGHILLHLFSTFLFSKELHLLKKSKEKSPVPYGCKVPRVLLMEIYHWILFRFTACSSSFTLYNPFIWTGNWGCLYPGIRFCLVNLFLSSGCNQTSQ